MPQNKFSEYMGKCVEQNKWINQTRDESRMDEMLIEIERVWRTRPDMRLGQLLVCVSGRNDLFSIEDEKLLNKLKECE